MSDAKHTPGPWAADDYHSRAGHPDAGFYIHATNAAGHFAVAKAYSNTIGGDSAEPNARLIAAAPDLLRALQDLSSLYDAIWVQMSNGEMDLVSAAWKQADAAIAKATSAKTIEFPATAFEGGPK